jgi:hypothetical protein
MTSYRYEIYLDTSQLKELDDRINQLRGLVSGDAKSEKSGSTASVVAIDDKGGSQITDKILDMMEKYKNEIKEIRPSSYTDYHNTYEMDPETRTRLWDTHLMVSLIAEALGMDANYRTVGIGKKVHEGDEEPIFDITDKLTELLNVLKATDVAGRPTTEQQFIDDALRDIHDETNISSMILDAVNEVFVDMQILDKFRQISPVSGTLAEGVFSRQQERGVIEQLELWREAESERKSIDTERADKKMELDILRDLYRQGPGEDEESNPNAIRSARLQLETDMNTLEEELRDLDEFAAERVPELETQKEQASRSLARRREFATRKGIAELNKLFNDLDIPGEAQAILLAQFKAHMTTISPDAEDRSQTPLKDRYEDFLAQIPDDDPLKIDMLHMLDDRKSQQDLSHNIGAAKHSVETLTREESTGGTIQDRIRETLGHLTHASTRPDISSRVEELFSSAFSDVERTADEGYLSQLKEWVVDMVQILQDTDEKMIKHARILERIEDLIIQQSNKKDVPVS